ncbi:protein of unknown function [Cyanobium sp. NIES-981]|nr:protein of unknown function [Cyanobium sp. NIES-981]
MHSEVLILQLLWQFPQLKKL